MIAMCEAIAGCVLFWATDNHSVELEAIVLWGLAAYSLYQAYAVTKQ